MIVYALASFLSLTLADFISEACFSVMLVVGIVVLVAGVVAFFRFIGKPASFLLEDDFFDAGEPGWSKPLAISGVIFLLLFVLLILVLLAQASCCA